MKNITLVLIALTLTACQSEEEKKIAQLERQNRLMAEQMQLQNQMQGLAQQPNYQQPMQQPAYQQPVVMPAQQPVIIQQQKDTTLQDMALGAMAGHVVTNALTKSGTSGTSGSNLQPQKVVNNYIVRPASPAPVAAPIISAPAAVTPSKPTNALSNLSGVNLTAKSNVNQNYNTAKPAAKPNALSNLSKFKSK